MINNTDDLLLKVCQKFQKEINELQESYSGLRHEIKFLMEERDKEVERIKKLENFMPDILLNFEKKLNDLEKYAYGSPASEVEEQNINLTFGQAIEKLKEGKKITRWHIDEIYVWISPLLNEMRVQTLSGKECPWLPNHEEILAENWRVIE